MSHYLLWKSPDLCTVSLLHLMVLKTISLGCAVSASLLLFFLCIALAAYTSHTHTRNMQRNSFSMYCFDFVKGCTVPLITEFVFITKIHHAVPMESNSLCYPCLGFPDDIFGGLFGGLFGGSPFGFGGSSRHRRRRGEDTLHPLR